LSDTGVQQFADAVEQMPALLAALRAAPRHPAADHPLVPNTPGIYMFSDAGEPVYVGQSRKLRARLKQHTGAKHGRDQASFAFNVAKREAAEAGVDVERFRSLLEGDPEFASHFDAARASVARMDVQFIEVPDPVVRTLFEVYAALALDTVEFNSFETH